VDATVVLCVSTAGCTAASGSYFDNSTTTTGVAATAIAAALTDGACAFPGPSWLRFKDATTTPVNGGPIESAKGRIQCSQMTATGEGTITVGDVTYQLAPPFTFENTPDCVTFCASFTSNVTLDGVVVGTAGDDRQSSPYLQSLETWGVKSARVQRE
jgi:hypothetical protein